MSCVRDLASFISHFSLSEADRSVNYASRGILHLSRNEIRPTSPSPKFYSPSNLPQKYSVDPLQ